VAHVNRFEEARAAIDAANADDPHRFDDEPRALVQGRLAEAWVVRLDPNASSALRLAARAHHLRRWVVPRSSYPDGRAGYLRWRRDQKDRHASELRTILERAGIESAVVDRAATIVAKVGLGTDPELQVFEDSVCLTFLETQLDDTADRLDHDRMIAVIAKTLTKMSEEAKAVALTIDLDARARELLASAAERSEGGRLGAEGPG
jgi:Domain of unknown function (DUF4202)